MRLVYRDKVGGMRVEVVEKMFYLNYEKSRVDGVKKVKRDREDDTFSCDGGFHRWEKRKQ